VSLTAGDGTVLLERVEAAREAGAEEGEEDGGAGELELEDGSGSGDSTDDSVVTEPELEDPICYKAQTQLTLDSSAKQPAQIMVGGNGRAQRLQLGENIIALEHWVNEKGITRIRCAAGWASEKTSSGEVQLLEETSEERAVRLAAQRRVKRLAKRRRHHVRRKQRLARRSAWEELHQSNAEEKAGANAEAQPFPQQPREDIPQTDSSDGFNGVESREDSSAKEAGAQEQSGPPPPQQQALVDTHRPEDAAGSEPPINGDSLQEQSGGRPELEPATSKAATEDAASAPAADTTLLPSGGFAAAHTAGSPREDGDPQARRRTAAPALPPPQHGARVLGSLGRLTVGDCVLRDGRKGQVAATDSHSSSTRPAGEGSAPCTMCTVAVRWDPAGAGVAWTEHFRQLCWCPACVARGAPTAAQQGQGLLYWAPPEAAASHPAAPWPSMSAHFRTLGAGLAALGVRAQRGAISTMQAELAQREARAGQLRDAIAAQEIRCRGWTSMHAAADREPAAAAAARAERRLERWQHYAATLKQQLTAAGLAPLLWNGEGEPPTLETSSP
jgi:hypothetical protein